MTGSAPGNCRYASSCRSPDDNGARFSPSDGEFVRRGFRLRSDPRYAPETVLFYTLCIAAVVWAVFTPPWKIASAHYGPRLWMLFGTLGLFSFAGALAGYVIALLGCQGVTALQPGQKMFAIAGDRVVSRLGQRAAIG